MYKYRHRFGPTIVGLSNKILQTIEKKKYPKKPIIPQNCVYKKKKLLPLTVLSVPNFRFCTTYKVIATKHTLRHKNVTIAANRDILRKTYSKLTSDWSQTDKETNMLVYTIIDAVFWTSVGLLNSSKGNRVESTGSLFTPS